MVEIKSISGRPELGLRRAAADGGDASAWCVPGDLQRSRMRDSHLDDQRGEVVLVARWRCSAISPSPAIARRSRGRRRLRSGVHLRVDLGTEKLGHDVQGMRTIETKRDGGKEGAGVVGARPELRFLPAAMAARRGQARAAWRRLARVFGARMMRRRWGIYRDAQDDGLARVC